MMTVSRRQLSADDTERAGVVVLGHPHPPRERRMFEYVARDESELGLLRVLELQAELGFVCWIHARRPRAGIAEALLRRASEDFAGLGFEDFCSAPARSLLRRLRDGGRWTLDADPTAREWGIKQFAPSGALALVHTLYVLRVLRTVNNKACS